MDSTKILEEIVGEALKSGTFQVVPNFDATHGKKYINLMLNHLIERQRTKIAEDENSRFYLFTENLAVDVYGKENLNLMTKLSSEGGDVRCILWEKSTNPNFNIIKNLVKVLPAAKRDSKISDKFIVINNSFANELKDLEKPHKAQFYFNVNKSDYRNNLKQRGIFVRYHTLNKSFEELWSKN